MRRKQVKSQVKVRSQKSNRKKRRREEEKRRRGEGEKEMRERERKREAKKENVMFGCFRCRKNRRPGGAVRLSPGLALAHW